ncbi:MAG: hypothetical protein H8E55_47100 [Pelagibacterales bacterium]|nr:hypothetical protein [Pelagibacterales bacterium]
MSKTNIDKPIYLAPTTEQSLKLADAEKYEFDALNEKLELLKEAWLELREPGETYDSWFKRTPRETIIRLTLGSGGKVIDFAKYRKNKEPKVKTIDIGQYFDLGRTLSSLSKSERETLNWILNKSLFPKD